MFERSKVCRNWRSLKLKDSPKTFYLVLEGPLASRYVKMLMVGGVLDRNIIAHRSFHIYFYANTNGVNMWFIGRALTHEQQALIHYSVYYEWALKW